MQSRTHAQAFAAYPLALLAAAFGFGILGGLYLVTPISLLIVAVPLLTVAAVAALLGRKMNLAVVFVSFAMFLVGLTLAAIDKNNVPANQLKRVLTKEPSRR